MASTESQGRTTRSTVLPVVVRIGNTKVTGIFGTIAITVSNKTGLPVVMEIGAVMREVSQSGFGINRSRRRLI